jgi:hypothetical protein
VYVRVRSWGCGSLTLNLDVDFYVLCECVEIVLFDRFLRERRQIDHHIFESPKGGVQIKILDVYDKEFGARGGNDTIDEDFFAVVRPAVRVDLSPGYSIWSPPTVSLVLSFSSL